MKKLILPLIVAMSLSTLVFAAGETAPVAGSTGQIKFIGQVTESGCTIVTGNTATINLGSMSVAAMKKSGFSGWTQGQIKFENCNLGAAEETNKLTKVNLTILPGTDGSVKVDGLDTWYNDGTASGVGVQVKIAGSEAAQAVPPSGISKPIVANIDAVNDTAVYTVSGRMVKTTEDVTPGSVEATLTFVASYQ